MGPINRRLILAAAAVVSLAACDKGASGSGAVGDSMVMGDPNAKVTVIEYASLSCTHCANFNNTVFPELKKKYIDTGLVKYELREFLTPPVQMAAAGFLLARCAGEEKYFDVVDALFHNQMEMFTTGDIRGVMLRVAQSAGMNQQQFNACVTNEEELQALTKRVEGYMRRDNIQATPTFLVNGTKVEGEASLERFDALIQPLLK